MKTIQPIVCTALLFLFAGTLFGQQADTDPFETFTHAWRDDPVWNDGLAECAVYDATRKVYGQERRYTARIFTNKEHVSPDTFTKSDGASGAGGTDREAFKLHVRDEVPTENYTYYYSTMTYVGVNDLKSLKLDMGSQEDCGTTFKQYINHAGTLDWRQHTYFPNEGARSGKYSPTGSFVFQDALELVLRGYPFDNPPKRLRVNALTDQTTTRLSEAAPLASIIVYEGLETLSLPFGEVKAHHLRFYHDEYPKGVYRTGLPLIHDYWFAADPGLRHVMVRYQGPGGQSYLLKSVKRRAYWR